MENTDPLEAARAMRRAMLGDDYVDSQATDPDPDSAAVAVPGLHHVHGLGRLDPGRRAHAARPEPARHGDDGGARPHGGVPPPRRQRARGPASPTRSSTNCCSRSPPTAARRRGSPPAGASRRCGRRARRSRDRGGGRVRGPRQHGRRAGREPGGVRPRRGDPRRPRPGVHAQGAAYADDVAEVARRAEVVVLSLPDGSASEQVADGRSSHVAIDAPPMSSTPRRSAWPRRGASPHCWPTPASATSTRRCRAVWPVPAPARSS